MKSLIQEIAAKIPATFILGLYGLSLVLEYYNYFNSATSEFVQKQQEIEVAEGQVIALQKKVKELDEFNKKLEERREKVRSLAHELGQKKNTLSEEINIAESVKTVSTEAERVGLKVMKIIPKKETKKEFYARMSFVLEVEGVYPQMLFFLDRLSNTQRIVRVDEAKFRVMGKSGKFTLLNGTMVYNVYRYLGSKADEVSKGDGA